MTISYCSIILDQYNEYTSVSKELFYHDFYEIGKENNIKIDSKKHIKVKTYPKNGNFALDPKYWIIEIQNLNEVNYNSIIKYTEEEIRQRCIPNIKEWLNNVEILWETRSISQLPKLPKCQILNISKKTVFLPELPNIEELYMSYCNQIQRLPNIENCKILDAHESGLIELPQLPNCEQLDIDGCEKITELPELSNCKELSIDRCYKIKSLPEMPKLEYLSIRPFDIMGKDYFSLTEEDLEKLPKKCRIIVGTEYLYGGSESNLTFKDFKWKRRVKEDNRRKDKI
jgi:hypothetical protein